MNKVKIGIAISLVVVVVMMGVYLVVSIFRGNANYTFASGVMKAKLVNTQEVVMDDLKSVEILYEGSGMDIFLYESDSDTLIVKEYLFDGTAESEYAVITKEEKDGKVAIKTGRDFTNGTIHFFSISIESERVEIYLPKDFHGDLMAKSSSGNIVCEYDLVLGKNVLTASSGDIRMKQITASDSDIKTSSGSIEIEQLSAPSIQVDVSSGDIDIEKADGERSFKSNSGDIWVNGGAGNSKFESSSGSITVSNIEGDYEAVAHSGNITVHNAVGEGALKTTSGMISLSDIVGNIKKAKTSSGDIEIMHLSGSLDAETSSGTVETLFDEAVGDVRVRSRSGGVELTILEDSFTFDAKTTSGEINTWFDEELLFNKNEKEASGTIGNAPTSDIKIETGSGDIEIQQ